MPVLFLLEGAFVPANVKLSMFGSWHPVGSLNNLQLVAASIGLVSHGRGQAELLG